MNNDCPNILPIKTPLQDYIYDVNLNTFVPVPQDVFQYAEKRLKNKNGTIEEKRKFDAMMENVKIAGHFVIVRIVFHIVTMEKMLMQNSVQCSVKSHVETCTTLFGL